VRYKARLVAQGFLQKPGIDYKETYSPVADAITFRFWISLVVTESLDMRLMDVVTAYLYGSLDTIKDSPTILYEDNAACITQIREGYIKGDSTRHISPKFFYTHELQKSGDIDVKQIRSSDNLADLFTKTLPTATFKKLVNNIGMRRLKDLSS
jgi:hypothetical protein